MKIKFWLRLSLIAAIPLFLSAMSNMIVSLVYWQGLNIDMSNVNHPLAFWIALISSFSIAIIALTMVLVMRYADSIDSLEERRKYYIKAKEEMETARDKYTELLSHRG